MRSNLLTLILTLILPIGIVTTGFAETSYGLHEASPTQVMSLSQGDTIYVDQGHCVSSDTSVGEWAAPSGPGR